MRIQKLIEKKRKEQKKKEHIKKAKIAGMAVLGASTGVAAGILFAPKSGKETRNDIANKSKELKVNLTEKTASVKENICEKVTEQKTNIFEAKEKISQYLCKKKRAKKVEEEIAESNEEELDTDIEGEI